MKCPQGLAPSTGNVRLHLQDDYSLIYDNLPIKQIQEIQYLFVYFHHQKREEKNIFVFPKTLLIPKERLS